MPQKNHYEISASHAISWGALRMGLRFSLSRRRWSEDFLPKLWCSGSETSSILWSVSYGSSGEVFPQRPGVLDPKNPRDHKLMTPADVAEIVGKWEEGNMETKSKALTQQSVLTRRPRKRRRPAGNNALTLTQDWTKKQRRPPTGEDPLDPSQETFDEYQDMVMDFDQCVFTHPLAWLEAGGLVTKSDSSWCGIRMTWTNNVHWQSVN